MMTPDERAAAEAAVNLFLQQAFQTAIIIFAVQYFARRAWRRYGLPTLPIAAWVRALVSSVSAMAANLVDNIQEVPNSTERAEPANERTNEPTRTPRTALHQAAERLQLDRTRPAVIAVLVAAGWKTTDIRDVLKGTAADIGQEVRAAQEAEPPPRTLRVKDETGERVIAL